MSLAAQPDIKEAEIGLEDAKRFLSRNDQGKLSELIWAEEMDLYSYKIRFEKKVNGADYKIFMAPENEVGTELVKSSDLEPYVSGNVDLETYIEFEGDEYGTGR